MTAAARRAIGDHDPIRLAVAAQLVFPDGSMTESGLRKEAEKGRLAVAKIANKTYTTVAAVKELIACQLKPKAPVSTFGAQDPKKLHGSSEMAADQSALESLRMNARKLKDGLPLTSPKSTDRAAKANVIPLKS